MKIGMTYDLRCDYLKEGFTEEETAEFDRERTVEGLEQALRDLGYEPIRIGHARRLVEALARGERWDLVFNIAEGLFGTIRESQVPAILDVYRIPYVFSDAFTLAVCLHKPTAKMIVREAGVATPDFAVVTGEQDLGNIRLRYPLFAKPIAEGTGKGITGASKICTAGSLKEVCGRLLTSYRQPVLVEEFLSGREFTVGIVGTGERARVLGAMEIRLGAGAEPGVYSYINKEECETRMSYHRAEGAEARAAEETALRAWRALGCRDGGRVDLRSDGGGRPYFMEVNPLAGLHPEHSDLPILCGLVGISYTALIGMIMESAQERAAE